LISDTILRENFVDLFEILPCFDLLITDYSSISYDWLLVNKPLVYFIPNIDIYKEKKKFLLEPLELWLPGPIATDISQLEEEIKKSLSNIEYYAHNRERIKKIIHSFADGNSCERAFNVIKNLVLNINI
jgi:CDP-glycerol glycerophosphotransferase (TagB/SpsB family)